jgi:hypothetical protein
MDTPSGRAAGDKGRKAAALAHAEEKDPRRIDEGIVALDAHLLDQAILERSVRPFDTAFGRRRVGADDLDAELDAALAVLIKEQADGNALDVAQVYAFRGEPDGAMHWLERAYAQKDPWLFQIKFSWLLKSLEVDPRYKAFLRKMNLPE